MLLEPLGELFAFRAEVDSQTDFVTKSVYFELDRESSSNDGVPTIEDTRQEARATSHAAAPSEAHAVLVVHGCSMRGERTVASQSMNSETLFTRASSGRRLNLYKPDQHFSFSSPRRRINVQIAHE